MVSLSFENVWQWILLGRAFGCICILIEILKSRQCAVENTILLSFENCFAVDSARASLWVFIGSHCYGCDLVAAGYVAVCCRVLQCVAVLHPCEPVATGYVAVCCSVVQYVAVCCSVV